MVASPREMIRLNAPGGVGTQGTVLWVQVLAHTNQYIKDPQPYGLLKIHEIGLDGQIISASFNEGGIKSFVAIDGPGCRGLSFRYASREESGL